MHDLKSRSLEKKQQQQKTLQISMILLSIINLDIEGKFPGSVKPGPFISLFNPFWHFKTIASQAPSVISFEEKHPLA